MKQVPFPNRLSSEGSYQVFVFQAAAPRTSLDLDSNTLVDDFSHIVVYTVSAARLKCLAGGNAVVRNTFINYRLAANLDADLTRLQPGQLGALCLVRCAACCVALGLVFGYGCWWSFEFGRGGLLIYSRSAQELVEQTTPAFVEVVDKGLTAREAERCGAFSSLSN